MSVFDTLRPHLKIKCLSEFSKTYVPALKNDTITLNKILLYDKKHNNGKFSFNIKCTQQYYVISKQIYDTIHNFKYDINDKERLGFLLARYALINTPESTLELLQYSLTDKNANFYTYNYDLNVFEYLSIFGDENIQRKSKELLYEYLNNSELYIISNYTTLLLNDKSDKFKELILTKKKSLNNIRDKNLKEKKIKEFNEHYLPHYARAFGIESLSYISTLFELSDNDIKYDLDDKNHFTIINSNKYFNVSKGIFAIKEMVYHNNFNENEKKSIVKLLTKINLQNSNSYFWMTYIKIIKKLYPKKSFADFSYIFSNLSKKYASNNEPYEYWNKKHNDINLLPEYLKYMSIIGYNTNQLTKKDIYLFQKNNWTNNEGFLINIFHPLKRMVSYDCETGCSINPYDQLINSYLKVCKNELTGYKAYFEYNINKQIEYKLLLSNGKDTYQVNPTDYGDWYDPQSVEELINTVLKNEGINKRFIQIETGDQTILSIYSVPGKLEVFANKYGFKILNK